MAQIYGVYCLFLSFILCAALWRCPRQNLTLYCWRRCFKHYVWIYNLLCSISLWWYLYRTKTAFQTDWSFVWHRFLELKIRSTDLNVKVLPRLNNIASNLISLFFWKFSLVIRFGLVVQNSDWSWIRPKPDLRITTLLIYRSEWIICVRPKEAVRPVGWTSRENMLRITKIYI